MKHIALRAIVLPAAVAALVWAAVPRGAFNPDAYVAHVRYLASPELKGRGAGTPELEMAAGYIERQFRVDGLKPFTPGGYMQAFQVTTDARLGPHNQLVVSSEGVETKLEPERDFIPFNFSAAGSASAPVVFAGYGITATEYNYDDYSGIDAKDKFVLIIRHEPQEMDEKSVFAGKNFTAHAQFAMKATNAKMHGARGVILVNDMPTHPGDKDDFEKFGRTAGPDNAGILFLQVHAAEADKLLGRAGKNLEGLITAIDHNLKPQSFVLPDVRVSTTLDIEREVKIVHNVGAYLPGQTKEYVIIGAHYDHLGLGDQHSMAPSEIGKPHPGADDNASGTAAVLELAKWFSKQPRPQRGVLFLAFAGEELGLLGSSYYVNHPELPLENAVAMINMDMIGRMRDSKIYVSGVGTGTTLEKLLDETKARHDVTIDISEKAGWGASDHTSFTAKQIPVLFFFSGLHADYHRPSDTWDKIDGPATARLLDLIADLSIQLANEAPRPQYVRVSEPTPQGAVGGGGGYGPSFGSVPDFSEVPGGGVKFADVREGSPAAKAGLKAGDILVEFDGKPIQNLYDFTYALRSKKPGDLVLVKVVRSGQPIEAKVLLGERK
jgi:Peptidase family M28/PDZ domain/PA domain